MGCGSSKEAPSKVIHSHVEKVIPSHVEKPLKEEKVKTSLLALDYFPEFAEEEQIVEVIRDKGFSPRPKIDEDSNDKVLSLSSHSLGSLASPGLKKNPKTMSHSKSFVGLDAMNETRREEGNLMSNCIPFELPLGRPIEEVYDGVHDGEVLGSGISGVVRLATHKATGHKYAVKCLDLDLIETAAGLQQLRDEIFIMCQLDHPNIIRLEEVYESHHEIFLVQELCTGGELFDRLDEQPDYHYTETQCARLIKQMLCGVRYLHTKGIIHRDLKLENFLFANTGPGSELKMIDFGLSKHFKFGEVQHDAVGTPYTVAPEVIRGSYDARCDIWGIGVISYLLLSGDPPFGGCGGPESLMTVRNNILEGFFKYEPLDVWINVSDQAKDFIRALLVTDPNKRPDSERAQQLPWIKEFAQRSNGQSGNNLLNPNVVKSLVAFKEYSTMRKLLCEVLSFTLLPDQIQNLREEFEVLDKEGTGEISLQSLKTVLMSTAGAGSLGALSEKEIEDIFNSMRVNESETTIHWHEFIAAGLSQCQVDDRNLRLAFDRMDLDHKGYITFKNVLSLLGSDGESEERVRRLYFGGLEDYQINELHITYDDFLAVMKGQSTTSDFNFTNNKSSSPSLIGIPGTLGMLSEEPDFVLHGIQESVVETKSTLATPLSPDPFDEDQLLKQESSEIKKDSLLDNTTVDTIPPVPSIPSAVRRNLNLPEHNHDIENIEKPIRDESQSALTVNKKLYRAHRQMRQSILDASKRLEEAQIKRLVREEEEKFMSKGLKSGVRAPAGLVMRRGQRKFMSTEEIRKILNDRMQEQQKQLAKANKLGGRGKRRRKKTVSDVTGMVPIAVPNKVVTIPKSDGLSCPPSPAINPEVLKDDIDGKTGEIPFMLPIQLNSTADVPEKFERRKMGSDSRLMF